MDPLTILAIGVAAYFLVAFPGGQHCYVGSLGRLVQGNSCARAGKRKL